MRSAALAILLLLALPSLAAASPWSLTDRAKVAVVDNPRFILEPCPDKGLAAEYTVGCTFMTDDAPIYITPKFADDWFVVYHELGHRFDHDALTVLWRRAFVRAWGGRWRGAWSSTWQERFADAYALCARNPDRLSRDTWVHAGYGREAHRAMCRLIDEAGIRAGLV